MAVGFNAVTQAVRAVNLGGSQNIIQAEVQPPAVIYDSGILTERNRILPLAFLWEINVVARGVYPNHPCPDDCNRDCDLLSHIETQSRSWPGNSIAGQLERFAYSLFT